MTMKFDKENFSKILIKIKDTYGSINQMADKTGVTSAYLSKLIRLMYDNAPSPEILKKIADNSNGVISYYELMILCGYVDYDNINIDEIIDNFFNKNPNAEFSVSYQDLKNRTLDENIALNNLFRNYRNIILQSKDLGIKYDLFVKDLPDSSKAKVSIIWGIYITYLIDIVKSFNPNSNINDINIKNINGTSNNLHMCPVYGQISAGQPNWVEECLEGYLPIDPNLMGIINPDECFFLRVKGESMNQLIKNGAYALIRKQDMVENGEIAVVLVNGDEATLKKFTQHGDVIVLEPMSDDPNFKTQIYDKNTQIQILGKYIGKFEMKK